MNDGTIRKRRAGGKAGHRIRAGTAAIHQMPWRIPVNPDRPTEPLDAEGVQAIHRGAMRILTEIGIEFLHLDAVEHLRAAGCTISGHNVRMDEDFVMEMLGRAPESFTITPRNPAREVTVGGKHMLFVNVSSPPNCLGSGARQAARQFRKLPGTGEAHPVFQLHPHGRRLPGRADRHPPLGPPPRLHLREADR